MEIKSNIDVCFLLTQVAQTLNSSLMRNRFTTYVYNATTMLHALHEFVIHFLYRNKKKYIESHDRINSSSQSAHICMYFTFSACSHIRASTLYEICKGFQNSLCFFFYSKILNFLHFVFDHNIVNRIALGISWRAAMSCFKFSKWTQKRKL